MTNNYRKIVGSYGERLAREYLERRGYEIIATNVKISYQEIDIVAKIKDKLVFVEVKTRTSASFGQADETIFDFKTQNLKNGISSFLENNKEYNDFEVHLDLIAIDINRADKTAKIKHYKDIF